MNILTWAHTLNLHWDLKSELGDISIVQCKMEVDFKSFFD